MTTAATSSRSTPNPATLSAPSLARSRADETVLTSRSVQQLAQRLLETGDLTVDAVAQHSGFRTADNLRKHFTRTLRTTPQAYRATFRTRPDGSRAAAGARPATAP